MGNCSHTSCTSCGGELSSTPGHPGLPARGSPGWPGGTALGPSQWTRAGRGPWYFSRVILARGKRQRTRTGRGPSQRQNWFLCRRSKKPATGGTRAGVERAGDAHPGGSLAKQSTQSLHIWPRTPLSSEVGLRIVFPQFYGWCKDTNMMLHDVPSCHIMCIAPQCTMLYHAVSCDIICTVVWSHEHEKPNMPHAVTLCDTMAHHATSCGQYSITPHHVTRCDIM
eukprot:gene21112-biopygen7099